MVLFEAKEAFSHGRFDALYGISAFWMHYFKIKVNSGITNVCYCRGDNPYSVTITPVVASL